MKELGRYDTDLQMFVEAPREPDNNHLVFMRGLVQEGRLQGDTSTEVIQLADVRAGLAQEALKEHLASNGDY